MQQRSRKPPERFRDAVVIAEESGLLSGARTRVVRGRMPEQLVARAKARTGIKSDTDLIQTALANLAVKDFDFLQQLEPSGQILFYSVDTAA